MPQGSGGFPMQSDSAELWFWRALEAKAVFHVKRRSTAGPGPLK